MLERSPTYYVMSCTTLYDSYSLQEPESINSQLEDPNFNPAGKNPSSISFNAFIWIKYY